MHRATSLTRKGRRLPSPPDRRRLATEASLVRLHLEERRHSRPSTYASIVQTVMKRDYVERQGRALVPKELGFIVPTFWNNT
ncbi:MAG: hypothetical protein IPF51_06045 [Dehalococcoidia bacterium]|uniref:DNA topoisomerase n=1 Tax=Candidatus Amarobacter glycogenicus TaxID=3140699 RepID=UPI00313643FE|nr:hypothetical protein [Dehalococcoidia bacterium]